MVEDLIDRRGAPVFTEWTSRDGALRYGMDSGRLRNTLQEPKNTSLGYGVNWDTWLGLTLIATRLIFYEPLLLVPGLIKYPGLVHKHK